MAARVFAVSILFAVTATPTNAYEKFRGSIPNGYMIRSPCPNVNMNWNGVGHENPMGSGPLNPFGEDFKDGEYVWNEKLCKTDSDGDGRTNGEELGDPNCMWYMYGPDPERTYNITHPGICTPLDSEQCKKNNEFLQCEENYECPQINATGVTRFPMLMDNVEIPAKSLSFFCKTFDIPTDQDYFVISTETIIDKPVVGTVLVYRCPDNALQIDEARECDESDYAVTCSSIIGLGSYGAPDRCFGDDVGFRVGQTSTKTVLLRVGYYNVDKVSGLMDSSGMAVYVRSAPADTSMDLRTLMFGTYLVEIPPGASSYQVKSVCKGSCTRAMVTAPAKIWGTIGLTGTLAGYAIYIEVYRSGTKIADLVWEDNFDPLRPKMHRQEPSLDLLPGDEITVRCIYNTMSNDRYTRGGEGIDEEVCSGFVTAYPYSAFSFEFCITFGGADICDVYSGAPLSTPMGTCNWYDFTRSDDEYTPNWVTEIEDYCSEDGVCRDMCKNTVQKYVDSEPCLSKEASLLVNWRLGEEKTGHRAMASLNTCRGVLHSNDEPTVSSCGWEDCYYYCDDSHYDAAPSLLVNALVMTVSVGLALFFNA